MKSGGCLCGGVRYQIHGELSSPLACHCSQCGRTSGNFAVMASCRSEHLLLAKSETLAWYRSSENVERGFCTRCGGNLFWKAMPSNETYVTLGTLDRPTGLAIEEHIFVGSKSDFYEITDAKPQKLEW
ncbi:MAG TPA: GFA family protein [Methylovirgula sp.]|nr:GFA family protein [Methylovirgula sp.]